MAVEHCEGTMHCQDIYPNGTKVPIPDGLKSVGLVLTTEQAKELGGLLRSIAAKSAKDATIDLTAYWRGYVVKVTRRRQTATRG